MSDKLHPAAQFCKKIIASVPGCEERSAAFRAGRSSFSEKDWPHWCDFPMAATYAILTDGAPIDIASTVLVQRGVKKLPELTAALIWQKSKTIYSFDSELASALLAQPLDGEIPGEALERLPHSCVYIETPIVVDNAIAQRFFAWLEWDINAQFKELRLLYLLNNGETFSWPVPIVGTLDKAISELAASAAFRASTQPQSVIAAAKSDAHIAVDTVLGSINLVLYLCSDEPDMQGELTGRTYHANGMAKRPAVIPVGTRIGAALRQTYQESGKQSGKQHSTPVPHIRRAHWHHYWTGAKKGERNLILKWLPPIPVNVGSEEAPSVIHKVKKEGK
jgi:hypothetical protein